MHHYQRELRVKVILGRKSQFREPFRPETSLVNVMEGSNRLSSTLPPLQNHTLVLLKVEDNYWLTLA